MIKVHIFMIVLASVFAGLATFKTPEPPRFAFLAAAAFVFLLATFIAV